MKHPFIVGSTYANNLGQYTVLEVTPPIMRVRYADGREQTVAIAVQARIWDRLQTPPEAIPDEAGAPHGRGSAPSTSHGRGAAFRGLLETDFRDNVTGTTWRSRDGLGGLVARQLRALSGKDFASWAIYRRPECFIYDPHLPMRNKAEGVKVPKFVVGLNPHEVSYGFYIEKSDEPMGDGWYWPRFMGLIAECRWQQTLERLMAEKGLHWRIGLVERQGPGDDYASLGQLTVSAFTPGSQFETFPDFVAYLLDLPQGCWCNLHLGATITRQRAMDLGPRIAEPVSDTFAALAPMYTELISRWADPWSH